MDAEPPKKTTKLPFKRTALRRQASHKSNEQDGAKSNSLDFFNRSRELQPLLTAEAQKRARREAEKEARNRKSPTAEKHDRPDGAGDNELSNSQKKRRMDEEQEDDMYDCTPPPPSTPAKSPSSTRKGATDLTPMESSSKHPRSSPASPVWKSGNREESPCPGNVGDSQDIGDDIIESGTRTLEAEKPNEVVEVNDDESDSDMMEDDEDTLDPATQALIDKIRAEQKASEEEVRDVVVQVISRIPGAAEALSNINKKHIRCKMKYHGEIKIVKETWCKAVRGGGFNIEAADIFLTWRDNRLYNSTTMQSLGIKFIGSSRYYAGDTANLSGFTEDRKNVLVEAWTDEAYKKYKEELEQEIRRERGEAIEPKERSLTPVQEAKIKITIRSKQGEPVKVSVPKSGTVADLVAKFRAKRHIAPDVKVTIVFDGEKLQDHLSLEDAEIDDDLQVDAQLG